MTSSFKCGAKNGELIGAMWNEDIQKEILNRG